MMGIFSKKSGRLCPACKVGLEEKTKYEITIDKCPKCGGLWLDKGEIEKIVRRGKDEKRA